MNKNGGHVISKIKASLAQMAHKIESEPVIFIDAKGKHWLNDSAREFVREKEISTSNFMDWLKIGSYHLQNFTYGDIDIRMIGLSEGEAIALLKHGGKKKAGSGKCVLTEKENEVLLYLAKGLANKQIAACMEIGPGTVNAHLDNIYQKLGCSNRLMACLVALQNGLLLPGNNAQRDKKK
jgi:DNA-binding CsgD family transcriptional regulator